jgi:hypothetical protein
MSEALRQLWRSQREGAFLSVTSRAYMAGRSERRSWRRRVKLRERDTTRGGGWGSGFDQAAPHRRGGRSREATFKVDL